MLFSALAANNIVVDMIVQSIREAHDDKTDMIFTINIADLDDARKVLEALQKEGRLSEVLYNDQVAKVSVVGAGMLGIPGVASMMFGALGDAGINIDIISTSEISISCLISRNDIQKAVRVIHDTFFKESAAAE